MYELEREQILAKSASCRADDSIVRGVTSKEDNMTARRI